ncbi:16973_t:CDS:2, partial [Entrophospora sp. SA101]
SSIKKFKLVHIENSDGDPSKWPDTTTKKIVDGTHIKIFYELDENSHAYGAWMEILGKAIAKEIKLKENLVLEQMPYGYKLFVQYKYSKRITPKELPMSCRTIKDGEECDPRGARFRSKNDFVPHCVWLYFNKKDSCKCNHCDKESHEKRKEAIRASRSLVRLSKQQIDTKVPKKVKKINENIDNNTLSIINNSKYQRGEIIWVSDTTLTFKLSSRDQRDNNNNEMEEIFWPGVIVEVGPNLIQKNYNVYSTGFLKPSSIKNQLDNYRYLIKLLIINKCYEYPTFALSPWLSIDHEELAFKYSNEIYLPQFLKAIQIASNVQKHYIMGSVYNYIVNHKEINSIKDPIQKQRIINAKNYPHYNDEYISKNYIQEEYTVDLEDIAGRFYPNMDLFNKKMNVKEEKTSREELFDLAIDQFVDNESSSSSSKIDNKCFMDNVLSNKQSVASTDAAQIYKSEDDEDATITDDDNNSTNDKTVIKESLQECQSYKSEENEMIIDN